MDVTVSRMIPLPPQRVADYAMPMHVTYRFQDHPQGTLASIRVRGDSGGYYRLARPLMSIMVRNNLCKDLRDLHRRLGS